MWGVINGKSKLLKFPHISFYENESNMRNLINFFREGVYQTQKHGLNPNINVEEVFTIFDSLYPEYIKQDE